MTNTSNENMITEARALVESYFKPVMMTGTSGNADSAPFMVLPDGEKGLQVHSIKKILDEYRTHPERRTGCASVTSLASLIDHTNRFSSKNSVLFADSNNYNIRSIIDYHEAGNTGTPAFCSHGAFYGCPLSEEWNAWCLLNGKPMDQIEFAEFLEDRIVDVELAPAKLPEKIDNLLKLLGGKLATPADLIGLSRGIKIHSSETVTQAQNLSSGESQIQYSSEHKEASGQPLRVPNLFLINVPVFEFGALYRVPVRLRYRLISGKITWSYSMYKPRVYADSAFTDACAETAKSTKLPIFYGTPEN